MRRPTGYSSMRLNIADTAIGVLLWRGWYCEVLLGISIRFR